MVYQDGTRFCAPTLECIEKEDDYVYNVSKGQFVGGTSRGSMVMAFLTVLLVFLCLGLCAQRYYYYKQMNQLGD